MQIDSLTEPQQEVVRLVAAGNVVNRRYHASIRALKDAGYLDQAGALTDAGCALLEESALRRQTPAAFRLGQRVESSVWKATNGCHTHEWQPGVVESIGRVALGIRLDSGQKVRRRAYYVRIVR